MPKKLSIKTADDANAVVHLIWQQHRAGDDEAAAGERDRLYEATLRAIASTDANGRTRTGRKLPSAAIARAALKASRIPIRW